MREGCYVIARCMLLCTAALCFWGQAQASDRLATPAIMSDRAAEGLLLDITRAGSRLVAVGDNGVVLLSDDEGRQWRQVEVPVSVMLTAVSFPTPQLGWATGHDGVLLTTRDGGEHWQRVMTGNDINALQVTAFQALLDAGGDKAVPDLPLDELEIYLDDAQIAREEGPSQPLLDVWFTSADQGFLLGSYGLLLKTTDGGQSWKVLSQRVPNIDRFHLNALLPWGDHLFIAAEAGLLFRSGDQGEHWEMLDSPYEGSFFALAAYRQQLLALGLRGHLFSTADSGTSWQRVNLPTTASLTTAAADGQHLLIAGFGGLVLAGDALDNLTSFQPEDRRAWSAAVRVHDGWVLAGEKGIKRITDQALEAEHE